MILNYIQATENIETVDRYNGGWLKKVEGLDKSVNNGYSIEGEFVNAGDYEQNYTEGIYLDCSKEGSRKNQRWNYHLFRFSEKNGVELLKTLKNAGRNWAVSFWEIIEQELNQKEDTVKKIVNSIYEQTNNEEELVDIALLLLDKVEKSHNRVKIAAKCINKEDCMTVDDFEEVDLAEEVKNIDKTVQAKYDLPG